MLARGSPSPAAREKKDSTKAELGFDSERNIEMDELYELVRAVFFAF